MRENIKIEKLNVGGFRNFFEIVPKMVSEKVRALPPEYVGLTEGKAVNLLFGNYTQIPKTDMAVRHYFWVEYDKAVRTGDPFRLCNVWKDVCSEANIYNIIDDQKRLAFLITEPPRMKAVAVTLLAAGSKRMEEILYVRCLQKKNKNPSAADVALLKLQFEIFKYLDQRENGLPVQRQQIEQKNYNLNVDGGSAGNRENSPPQTMEELDRRLKELEGMASNPQRQLNAGASDMDVEIAMSRIDPSSRADVIVDKKNG